MHAKHLPFAANAVIDGTCAACGQRHRRPRCCWPTVDGVWRALDKSSGVTCSDGRDDGGSL